MLKVDCKHCASPGSRIKSRTQASYFTCPFYICFYRSHITQNLCDNKGAKSRLSLQMKEVVYCAIHSHDVGYNCWFPKKRRKTSVVALRGWSVTLQAKHLKIPRKFSVKCWTTDKTISSIERPCCS